MKIRYKLLTNGCKPVINDNGDAFDLRAAKDIEIKAPQAEVQKQENNEKVRNVRFNNLTIVPLGIAIELPKGFVADLKPRSSTCKKWWVIQTNSPGLIDNSYNSDTDEWGLPVVALQKSTIHKGDKICQFEIRPSQNATWWQWLKWIFKSGIEFVEVESLGNEARGGFGSTGSR